MLFEQSLIDAGQEVNDALADRQTASETVRLTGAPVRTLGHRVPVAVENRRPVS